MKKFGFGIPFVLLMLMLTYGQVARADFGGNPWTAVFFPTNNLSGAGVPVTGISGINFNWGTGVPIVNGVPVSGMPADNFSARFTSTQNFVAGTYHFVVASDDGIRVFIDGQVVLDKFIARPLTTDQFNRTLSAGSHQITIEYFDNIDHAIIQFQWFPDQPVITNQAPIRDYYASLTVPLSWTPISWATGYEVEVSTTKAFAPADLVDHQDTLSADTLSWMTTVPQSGLYYWRVRAQNLLGMGATWSAIQSFTASGP